MSKLKHWISAFRVRTLFLAVSSVILGSGIAIHSGSFSTTTAILAVLLAISIQILSNLSNDLGDYLKGTDITGKRVGPKRTVQSGIIKPQQMRIAIIINTFVVATIGLALIFTSVTDYNNSIYILIAIGLICILSALLYTMGRYAYGYVGWGDFFAFLFFGPVAVLGTYFLHTNTLSLQAIAPSVGLGLISTMILNINNMRDIENDTVSGKITVASKIGLHNAKIYHTLMTLSVFVSFLSYSFMYAPLPWYRFAYVLVFAFQIMILKQLWGKENRELDPFLKLTSISGFILSLIFALCINI